MATPSTPSTNLASGDPPVAVVTGAARGIGAAVCSRLRMDGYHVVGLDLIESDDTRSNTGAVQIREQPVFTCDVSDHRQVSEIAARVERDIGPVTVLVNNAAIWSFGSIEDTSPVDFDRVLAVNIGGTFNCTQAFGRHMLGRSHGSIVNMVSIAALAANPNVGAYSASKAAVVAFTRQTALEWGPRGIRANAVGPGFVPTPGAGQVYDDEAVRTLRANAVPLKRLAEPSDIADAVAFLTSDQSSYVNGQVLYVDGGMSQALMTLIPRPPSVSGPHLESDSAS